MVKVMGVPVQVSPDTVLVGVIVIVAVIGVEPAFTAVKAGILPVPEAAKPIDALLLVQLNVVPATDPVTGMAVLDPLLHKVRLVMASTDGVWTRLMVIVLEVSLQPAALVMTTR
jgi:hypothetical protein